LLPEELLKVGALTGDALGEERGDVSSTRGGTRCGSGWLLPKYLAEWSVGRDGRGGGGLGCENADGANLTVFELVGEVPLGLGAELKLRGDALKGEFEVDGRCPCEDAIGRFGGVREDDGMGACRVGMWSTLMCRREARVVRNRIKLLICRYSG
jgi:hypothetical protein